MSSRREVSHHRMTTGIVLASRYSGEILKVNKMISPGGEESTRTGFLHFYSSDSLSSDSFLSGGSAQKAPSGRKSNIQPANSCGFPQFVLTKLLGYAEAKQILKRGIRQRGGFGFKVHPFTRIFQAPVIMI